MVEGDENLETGGEETITFLYKFCDGVCPKSYGFNAARLAEIPQHVVLEARRAAKQMEARNDAMSNFKNLFNAKCSIVDKRELIKSLPLVVQGLKS